MVRALPLSELLEGFRRLGARRWAAVFNVDMLNEISLIKCRGCRALRKLRRPTMNEK